MSIAYKWLGGKTEFFRCKIKKGKVDDLELVLHIFELLDQADVVIAHHGDAFDIKKINARFAFYGLGAPSFYQTIDTKKVAFRYFRFDSNKLNELGQYLGEGKKAPTGGFDLWDDCLKDDPKAWAKMKKYNIQDVDLLERIYLRLRPFMTNHPNLNVIADKKHLSCPTCLSDNVLKRGFAITRAGSKQRFQCGDCGSWSSGPITKANITLR